MGGGVGTVRWRGVLPLAPAMRALLSAYNGWYAPIYTAEESADASRTLRRAIIGGAMRVAAMYVTLNIALLRVLSIPDLAASTLPVAVAARVVLPRDTEVLVTGLSVLNVLGLINGNAVIGPRILFLMAREGRICAKAAAVVFDWRAAFIALVFLGLGVPAYALALRSRAARAPAPRHPI